jgi:NTP pyrophosphatase (non-canonical NTP hydrolase)
MCCRPDRACRLCVKDIPEAGNKFHDKDVYMKQLQAEIKDFIERRGWQRYHSPKNLAMALSVETAELVEIFQWLTPSESAQVSDQTLQHIEEEIGDIMIYLTTLAASYGLDPVSAAQKKLIKNGVKYPEPDKSDPATTDDTQLSVSHR